MSLPSPEELAEAKQAMARLMDVDGRYFVTIIGSTRDRGSAFLSNLPRDLAYQVVQSYGRQMDEAQRE